MIDLYLELRKRQYFIHTFVNYIALNRTLRVVAQNYKVLKENRRKKHNALFAIMQFKIRWKKRMRRHRSDVKFKLLHEIRGAFMFFANTINGMQQEFHMAWFKHFLARKYARIEAGEFDSSIEAGSAASYVSHSSLPSWDAESSSSTSLGVSLHEVEEEETKNEPSVQEEQKEKEV